MYKFAWRVLKKLQKVNTHTDRCLRYEKTLTFVKISSFLRKIKLNLESKSFKGIKDFMVISDEKSLTALAMKYFWVKSQELENKLSIFIDFPRQMSFLFKSYANIVLRGIYLLIFGNQLTRRKLHRTHEKVCFLHGVSKALRFLSLETEK